jgi:hypothetical protein
MGRDGKTTEKTLCGRVVEEIVEMYIVTWRLRAGIVEPEETSITRQMLGKHLSATTPTDGIIFLIRCFLWVGPEAI